MANDPLNIILKNQSGVRLNPHTIATQVDMNDTSGAASNVSAEIVALRTRIDSLEGIADALHFKGVVDGDHALPTTGVNLGDVYKVGAAGTFASQTCEVGDMIICVAASPVTWSVIQNNIDGAVTGPATSTGGNLVSFSGTTGKVVQDSSLTTTDVSDAVTKKHAHENSATLDAITSTVKTGYDAASTFVSSLDSSVTAAALKDVVAHDHTHSNKTTLDAIDATTKAGYDTAVTEASKIDAVVIAKGGTIPSTLRSDGIVFELEA